jgi:hypothetical protein
MLESVASHVSARPGATLKAEATGEATTIRAEVAPEVRAARSYSLPPELDSYAKGTFRGDPARIRELVHIGYEVMHGAPETRTALQLAKL